MFPMESFIWYDNSHFFCGHNDSNMFFEEESQEI